MRNSAWLVCALSVLSACGGGGGGSDGSWLKVEPAALTLELYQGDPTDFAIAATQVGSVDPGDGVLYVGVVESDQVLEPGYEVIPVDNADWLANLHVSRTLAVGVHTGTFELRLCHDADISVCARPWPGSPWVIPYKLTVREGTNLKELTQLPDAGPWSTFGGNAAHTGYVPAPALSKANFGRRWGFVPGGDVSAVAIDGGLVYVVSRTAGATSLDDTYALTAVRESDGQEEWHQDLGRAYHVSAPAVGNGHVYLTATGGQSASLEVFDAATGEAKQGDTMGTQWGNYGAPEVYGAEVYSQAGTYGGMVRFDDGTLTEHWFSGAAGWCDEPYTPAADGTYVYARLDGALVLLDPADGSLVTSIADALPSGWNYYKETGGAVLGTGGLVFASYLDSSNADGIGGRLVAYDMGSRTRKWALQGKFSSAPVLAGGVLYVVDGDVLDARSPSTGALLWSWTPAGGLEAWANEIRHLAVVGGKAVVDGGHSSFIVDLATHATDFAYPAGGPIAVSDQGVVYISGRNGALVAINLQ